jgi:hypothetical protein
VTSCHKPAVLPGRPKHPTRMAPGMRAQAAHRREEGGRGARRKRAEPGGAPWLARPERPKPRARGGAFARCRVCQVPHPHSAGAAERCARVGSDLGAPCWVPGRLPKGLLACSSRRRRRPTVSLVGRASRHTHTACFCLDKSCMRRARSPTPERHHGAWARPPDRGAAAASGGRRAAQRKLKPWGGMCSGRRSCCSLAMYALGSRWMAASRRAPGDPPRAAGRRAGLPGRGLRRSPRCCCCARCSPTPHTRGSRRPPPPPRRRRGRPRPPRPRRRRRRRARCAAA